MSYKEAGRAWLETPGTLDRHLSRSSPRRHHGARLLTIPSAPPLSREAVPPASISEAAAGGRWWQRLHRGGRQGRKERKKAGDGMAALSLPRSREVAARAPRVAQWP